jgi:hypothetical protein
MAKDRMEDVPTEGRGGSSVAAKPEGDIAKLGSYSRFDFGVKSGEGNHKRTVVSLRGSLGSNTGEIT